MEFEATYRNYLNDAANGIVTGQGALHTEQNVAGSAEFESTYRNYLNDEV